MVGGSLNFDRNWSRYHLTTSYSGGDSYNMSQIPPNGMFHDLLIVQQADWDRWHVLLRDDFRAAPGASFTGQGMGGPGLIAQFSSMLTASMSTLSPAFIPSETIDTGNTMRYRNSLLGQAEYSFSRRSAFTFAGSYGILHFASTGYFSSQMMNAQVGYDYLLDPSNSIAILGSYGKIDYTGITNTLTNYMAALAYGRKITGRLAFQIAAGPQQIRSAGGDANFQLWVTSVNSALSYERRRGGLTLHFMRGLTSGSGVFIGATSNTISGAAHYRLTRFWMANLNAGYALNKSLPIAGAPTRNFDTWFVGANLGRRIGSHVRFNLNYGLQRQNNPAVCPVTYCGPTGFQQTVGVTANWHLRPVE